MTKSQLLQILEPFTDEIDISVLGEANYKYSPRLFYYMNKDGIGELLMVTSFKPQGKAVELKIKD